VKKPHCKSAQVWHVLSRDFTVLPAHPRMKWTIPVIAFSAEAGPHLLTPWKTKLRCYLHHLIRKWRRVNYLSTEMIIQFTIRIYCNYTNIYKCFFSLNFITRTYLAKKLTSVSLSDEESLADLTGASVVFLFARSFSSFTQQTHWHEHKLITQSIREVNESRSRRVSKKVLGSRKKFLDEKFIDPKF